MSAAAIKPMFFSCVACQAEASKANGQQAVLALVVMLHTSATLEDIYRETCSYHRAVVDEAIAEHHMTKAVTG